MIVVKAIVLDTLVFHIRNGLRSESVAKILQIPVEGQFHSLDVKNATDYHPSTDHSF